MPAKINPALKNTLLMLLVLMRHKAEDSGKSPIITIAKLTDIMKLSKMDLSYHQLLDLVQDPSISKLVKSINKNQLEVRTEFNDDDLNEPSLEDEEALTPPEDEEALTPPEDEEGEDGEDGADLQSPEEDTGMEDDGSLGMPPPSPEEISPPTTPAPPRKPSLVTQMAKRAMSRN